MGTSVRTRHRYIPLNLASGQFISQSPSFAAIAAMSFDLSKLIPVPNDPTFKLTFSVVMFCDAGASASVRLFDVAGAAAVANSTLSTTNNSETVLTSDITSALSGSTRKIYEVQLARPVGGGTTKARLQSAFLEVEIDEMDA